MEEEEHRRQSLTVIDIGPYRCSSCPLSSGGFVSASRDVYKNKLRQTDSRQLLFQLWMRDCGPMELALTSVHMFVFAEQMY